MPLYRKYLIDKFIDCRFRRRVPPRGGYLYRHSGQKTIRRRSLVQFVHSNSREVVTIAAFITVPTASTSYGGSALVRCSNSYPIFSNSVWLWATFAALKSGRSIDDNVIRLDQPRSFVVGTTGFLFAVIARLPLSSAQFVLTKAPIDL